MTNQDDMVIAPELDTFQASTPTRARQDRRLAAARRGRGGILRKLAKARAAQRLARIRKMRASGRVATGGGGLFRGTAGRLAAINPTGAVVTAGVVAIAVLTRLASGRSFENIGEQVNQILLGDLDEEARANLETRKRLGSDPNLLRVIGQEGKVNSQIATVFKGMAEMRKRELVGESILRRETAMQNNGTFDLLIVRARDKFLQAFRGSGGDAATAKFRDRYRETLQTAGKGGAR